MRLEVRYDPEWLKNFSMPILLYHEGKKVGEAYRVNFHDNAHVKRKYGGNRKKDEKIADDTAFNEKTPAASISFTDMMN
jgi:hypothetical protein